LDQAYKEAEEVFEMSQKQLMDGLAKHREPPKFQFISKNFPANQLKKTRVSVEICNCRAEDEDPCGYLSYCINRELKIECSVTCRAGERCGNQVIQNRQQKEVEIFFTGQKGW
jgi:histone-lysine N-methyltransferase NSD1